MRKKIIFISVVAALALAAVMAGVIYQRWRESPRYALQQMVLAIKAKNMDNIFKFLNLKDIFNNLLEASLKEEVGGDDKNKGRDDFERFSRQLGRSFARKLAPKLFDNFEKQIREFIVSYLLDLDNSQILALTAAVTTAQIEVQGEKALVTIQAPRTQKPVRFTMRRLPEGRVWQVVSLNYDDVKHLLKKEFLGTLPQR
jgi:hypothetical protein